MIKYSVLTWLDKHFSVILIGYIIAKQRVTNNNDLLQKI